jgi:hypothetical protein
MDDEDDTPEAMDEITPDDSEDAEGGETDGDEGGAA